MSAFPEREKLASIFHTTDSDGTKVTDRNATAAFTIMMYIIRRGEDTVAIMGAEYGDFVSNVNGSYAHASEIRQGDKIVCDGLTYFVANKPKYNGSFNKYRCLLRTTK